MAAREQEAGGMVHHAAGGEVRALLVLLAIADEAVKGPDTIGHEVVRLE